MKPGLAQQALAGLAVLFVIAVTTAGAVLLAFSDNPEAAARMVSGTPTATPYRLATLPPETVAGTMASPPPTVTMLPTATQTPTSTVLPTNTLAPVLPTNTPDSPTRMPTAIPCRVQTGWVPYVVQPGETLFEVGLRYGLRVDALQRGSCLASATLEAGQVIYVPPTAPVAPTSVSPPTAGPTPTSTGGSGICSTPDATFTRPRVAEVLSGVVSFYGTATHPAFSFYKLELRQEGASTSAEFTTFYTSYQPVVNGLLGQVDTHAFPNGEYWLRLVVVDQTSNYPEPCTKLVVFRN